MGSTTSITLALALIITTGVASPARAQQPPAPVQVAPALSLGTVYIEEDSGIETRGRLLRFDARTLELRTPDGEARRFDMNHVRRVSKRGDSLKNGAAAGAVVGLVMGVFAAGFSDGCNGTGQQLAMVAVATSMYASIGVAIDAAIPGRTVIYQRGTAARPAPPADHAGR